MPGKIVCNIIYLSVSGDWQQVVSNLKAGPTIKGSVIVKSGVESLHFIPIEAKVYFRGTMVPGSTSVALQVGTDRKLKKSGPVRESDSDPKKELYIEMPAKGDPSPMQ